ncbi:MULTISPECIES: cyanobactin biosynthesis system PatB/AcyB/McaB family protein [unclassified Bradyrhizobium]|uniref:cyanobactin biosynthesis system PatB/AcyB/McaB family protein n=1 Tax=unclassified Bradyrhizobium TaxID=2631580 RepID=UPI00211EDD96|nr:MULTISPECIES: cyanobactin biosynthesis system PatB/AcyB/McaB family protein [unclassified Bradyrhizobium]MDD1534726.1 cyanobactin biosynthesis system PatB/AcyB/McaB family protein [Bradyrhizobium sp. WBOS8]MDD1584217.1 cyanobactin biosynthesis system PatB/AcyB/McaB family protein [Bradyrhizobium sp. WBOS4]UUO50526.1 cyanobactin biosynthesis system PatB/AcyB/McaB family protein [Bradyrhizobium sp. WBOS04]UUO57904.1 cyanobactin biosynthesis system PatB/AcyB/McaB family protein [Bradyrhizobium 
MVNINPILSRPVKRPHFVDPSTCVDVVHGRPGDLISLAISLIHGANYNDPAPFEWAAPEQVISSAFVHRRF